MPFTAGVLVMRFLVLAFILAGAVFAFSGCATVNDNSAALGGGSHLEPISVTLTGTVPTVNAGAGGDDKRQRCKRSDEPRRTVVSASYSTHREPHQLRANLRDVDDGHAF